MSTVMIFIFVSGLAVSYLLSGMEAGVFALSRLRVRQQMRAGNARAAALHRHLEQPEDFLWTILVGNTVANVAVATIAVIWLHKLLWPWPAAFVAAFIIGGVMFYALCELWPKMLFRLYPNRLCMGLARPFGFIHFVLRPLVSFMAWLANKLLRWTGGKSFTGHLFGNREELRHVMQESAQGLSNDERVMINRVLDLQNITVQQVLVPMARVETVPASLPVEAVLTLSREKGFNRLPVWKSEGAHQRIAGLISVRSLLYQGAAAPGKTAGDFLKPAVYFDHDTRLEIALRRLQRTGQRLAIILGPDRREIGILCLEDILKVIFGEVKL